MSPEQLVLRCMAERKAEYWQAFCLDLNLAVQGDSFEDVRSKLHDQIGEYLYDALEGEDQQYAAQLLSRKSPLSIRARYRVNKFFSHLHSAKNGVHQFFKETMPLRVAC
tara:strand:- start:805 stop:1131 length:327 start_codon:yes stop_codon:yes gene_type:complete